VRSWRTGARGLRRGSGGRSQERERRLGLVCGRARRRGPSGAQALERAEAGGSGQARCCARKRNEQEAALVLGGSTGERSTRAGRAAGGRGPSSRRVAVAQRGQLRQAARGASGTPGVRAAPERGGAVLMAVAGAGRVGAEAQEPERELGERV
jgi:hypothetical protein